MKYTFFNIEAEILFMDKPELFISELNSHIKDNQFDNSAITKIECWVSVSNHDEFSTISASFYNSIAQYFNQKPPASILLAQKPTASKDHALLKISYCDDKTAKVEHKQFQKHPYTLLTFDNECIIFSGGISNDQQNDHLRKTQEAYDFVEQLLDHEEMHFGQIYHQWNYVENIDSMLCDPHTQWTPGQTVKEIRSLYFDPNLFKHGYPLQTSIGINCGGYITDFIATSKDGFPSAQIKGAKNQQTKSIYAPALKEVHINVSSDSETCEGKSISEQTITAINAFNTQLIEGKLENGLISEVKVFIRNSEDFEIASTIIEKNLQIKNVIYLVANSSAPSTLISLEGLVKVEA